MFNTKQTFQEGFISKHIWIVGLARSGMAAAKALTALGVQISVWDDSSQVLAQQAKLFCILSPADIANSKNKPDILLLSPGIASYGPACHASAIWANENNVPILCDVSLFCQLTSKATHIAITGTNGKSTLTAIVAHILQKCLPASKRVQFGGNIGNPCFELSILNDDDVYVLELSSYQLERMGKIAFDLGALINITPDHLDRHLNIDNYINAKKQVFLAKDSSKAKGFQFVAGIDTLESATLVDSITDNVIKVSVHGIAEDRIGVKEGILYDGNNAILELGDVAQLPGKHNAINLGCAWALVKQLGVSACAFVDTVRSFSPLLHRQCEIATVNDIRFVDDSKATNAEAAIHALRAWPNCYWIAGGQAKKEDYNRLLDCAVETVEKVYLIGSSQEMFSAMCIQKNINFMQCDTLERAVKQAFLDACQRDENKNVERANKINPVILLSPGAASFDQFDNFEARGKAFASLVNALKA